MSNNYETINNFNLIQTFYADPEVVNKSGDVSLTSVDLYFKTKPSQMKNVSGKPNPGVTVCICEVINDLPDLTRVYSQSISRKEYDEIYSFSDASTATAFGFSSPVKILTGRFYGVVVIFDDPGFELWVNKQGDKLVGTNTASPGTNIVKDGKMYLTNNSGIFNALSDTDLKFTVSVANYASNTHNTTYINRNFEFFKLRGRVGHFLGGEWVYREVANATGNVSITQGNNVIIGVGTDFTVLDVGTKFVVHGPNSKREILTVQSVTNSTYMTVTSNIPFTSAQTKYKVPVCGKVYYRDDVLNKLFLEGSTANTTAYFSANDVLVGIESGTSATVHLVDVFKIDRVRVKGDIRLPAAGCIKNLLTTAVWDGTKYIFNDNNTVEILINDSKVKNLTKFASHMLSRSDEVRNANLYSFVDALTNVTRIHRKSFKLTANLCVSTSSNGLFSVPSIDTPSIDIYTTQNIISNTYTQLDANNIVIDTEVAGNGLALSRHIAKKVTFANNRFAEDIRVYMNAYRPANTDLKVYARVYNSQDPEAFDDKVWTPLEYVENGTKFSSSEDQNDLIEYELGLPAYAPSAVRVPGTFTTQLANTVVVASGGNPSTYLANNNVIKLYNPLIPEDYIVGVVASVNSTAIVLGSAIANNNVVGTGFAVDRLKYYNTAFNNITNDNVCRYYNSSLVEFDTFDAMQIKIVMLADSTNKVPKIDQIQVIGVSA